MAKTDVPEWRSPLALIHSDGFQNQIQSGPIDRLKQGHVPLSLKHRLSGTAETRCLLNHELLDLAPPNVSVPKPLHLCEIIAQAGVRASEDFKRASHEVSFVEGEQVSFDAVQEQGDEADG